MENKDHVDVFYLDIIIPFDSLKVRLVARNLLGLGVQSEYVSWIRSFLTDCIYRVKVGSSHRTFQCTSRRCVHSYLSSMWMISVVHLVSLLISGCDLKSNRLNVRKPKLRGYAFKAAQLRKRRLVGIYLEPRSGHYCDIVAVKRKLEGELGHHFRCWPLKYAHLSPSDSYKMTNG